MSDDNLRRLPLRTDDMPTNHGELMLLVIQEVLCLRKSVQELVKILKENANELR